MYGLVKHGIITEDQIKAWDDVRHAAMHGELTSPYSTREGDANYLSLANMMRSLTWEVVRRGLNEAA